MGKEGAFLIITGAGAEASGITVTDFGSAAVYNGAKISDSVVEAGGVLTMSYRKLNDGASAGSAENITVKEDGLFWVGTLGSTANNVTFEAGSFIGGFGLGEQGTTFTNSKVIGYDGSETELAYTFYFTCQCRECCVYSVFLAYGNAGKGILRLGQEEVSVFSYSVDERRLRSFFQFV